MCSGAWRAVVIKWLYLLGIFHLLIGILITWGNPQWFVDYQIYILERLDLMEAGDLHIWWWSLFGATFQAFSILFIALVHLGNKFRIQQIWLYLILALLVWAPQDIYFSAIKQVWINVWLDLLAMVSLLPGLIYCYVCDVKSYTHFKPRSNRGLTDRNYKE